MLRRHAASIIASLIATTDGDETAAILQHAAADLLENPPLVSVDELRRITDFARELRLGREHGGGA